MFGRGKSEVQGLKSEVRSPSPAKTNATEPATRSHCSWSCCAHLPPQGGGEALRWPAVLSCPKSRDGGGGRNARAPARAFAHFWKVPRQFTLENRRLPLHPPQSSGELRNSHVFDEPTLGEFVAHRNS